MTILRNVTTGEVVAREVHKAQGWYERAVGFIGRHPIESREALWLDDCSVIHTIGMRSEIDVVFLDKCQRVLRTVCSVPRNRFAVACPGARAVVELGSGALQGCDVLVGDRFELED